MWNILHIYSHLIVTSIVKLALTMNWILLRGLFMKKTSSSFQEFWGASIPWFGFKWLLTEDLKLNIISRKSDSISRSPSSLDLGVPEATDTSNAFMSMPVKTTRGSRKPRVRLGNGVRIDSSPLGLGLLGGVWGQRIKGLSAQTPPVPVSLEDFEGFLFPWSNTHFYKHRLLSEGSQFEKATSVWFWL